MQNSWHGSRPWARPVTCLAAIIPAVFLAAGVLSACSGDDGATPSKPAVERDATKAATALENGLKAQTAGKLDEAESQYREALKYDPGNKFAMYDLAVIDATRSNYGLAAEKYRAVLATDAKYAPALFNLAILERQAGNTKESAALYRRAIAVNPKDAASHLNLGLLLRETGNTTVGDAEVKTAITLNPKLRDPAKTAKPAAKRTAPPSAAP